MKLDSKEMFAILLLDYILNTTSDDSVTGYSIEVDLKYINDMKGKTKKSFLLL